MKSHRTPGHDRIIVVTKGALRDVNLALSGLTLLLGQIANTEAGADFETAMDWANALQWLRDSIGAAIASPQEEIARQEAGQ
ncbi:hypothetical protein HLH26_12745 [Gluconacetobacter sp. 1b LMG 1731]|uniref:Uncharacterized protein n=1 Tax=Gluconacetobacter dulcium TaxID=2729096 RepID=A0A7W4IM31_9PROT|nr:hypothetical protein [Gluconacetobacter dulcium]MBB2165385.1 hypothetical protein [Gluconacetobacter dulcium]MBB2194448.1 hypothetical protein [Gluconacetobacter dulcium]